MKNSNEQTKIQAIQHIQDAESYLCLTVREGTLDIAVSAKPNTLGMMLLAVMRTRPDFADAVNFAALAYAREKIIPPQESEDKENQ